MHLPRQIIALGGGFIYEPMNPSLDSYVLNQCRRTSAPKICFLPTASGDSSLQIQSFFQSFSRLNCEPSVLSLFRGEPPDIEKFIFSQDIVYVGGGNARNMLALWRDWGLDVILRAAYHQGVILAGVGAGAICWFERFLIDSTSGPITAWSGLGFLRGFAAPYFDGDIRRQEKSKKFVATGALSGMGYGINEKTALHFVDETLFKSICSEPQKKKCSYQDNVWSESNAQYIGHSETLIRGGHADDWEACLEIKKESVGVEFLLEYSLEKTQAYLDHCEAPGDFLAPDSRTVVLESKGRLQGFARIQWNHSETVLTDLYLRPAFLRKSWGRKLFQAILQGAESLQLEKITALCPLNAHRFFTQIGFFDRGGAIQVRYDQQILDMMPIEFICRGAD